MWEYQLSLKIHVIVNNTFGTGEYFIKPIVRGADIVVHMQRNNGTTIRGVVIDEGDANVGAAFIDALQLASHLA
ncbi:unnamed protein product [Rhizophagus irregularis]|nr:unnamed protein product [Rhizophagus irregularis]CAB5375810.1 unnamed protein product [Rhizophagus irregularis]